MHWQLHHYTTHHYTTGHFIPNKYLSLVFYENRDLKISKSKKSEQYFRDKIEFFLFVSSMNTLLAILKGTDARRDVILASGLYRRFPWRHRPFRLVRTVVKDTGNAQLTTLAAKTGLQIPFARDQ